METAPNGDVMFQLYWLQTRLVLQVSVLRQLNLVRFANVSQSRPGPENSDLRVVVADKRPPVYYLTDGSTHQNRRDRGRFSVYR